MRQRYLLVWLIGWLALVASRWALDAHPFGLDMFSGLLLRNVFFAISLVLFALAAFQYTGERGRRFGIWLPGLLCMVAGVAAAFRPSFLSVAAFSLIAWAVIAVAVGRLWLFALGRRQAGPWLFSAGLLMLVPELHGVGTEYGVASGVALWLGVLILLLDESNACADRIEVMRAITTSAFGAREAGSVTQFAMQELSRMHGAACAWFQRLDGKELLLENSIGISQWPVGSRSSLTGSDLALFAQNPQTVAVRTDRLPEKIRQEVEPLGMRTLVAVPVMNKENMVGLLGFGFTGPRQFTTGELDFLTTTAQQLGIARESLAMFERVANSQHHWLTTIDSIDDYILVHDHGARVLRLNQALARRLGRPLRELLGLPISSVLPNAGEGCPYCRLARETGAEVPDPCFGGYSLISTSPYTQGHGEPLGTVHVICDRTARRAAEERYRILFESVHEGVFVSTPEGKLVDCNPAFASMLGYAGREEMLGIDITEALFPAAELRAAYIRDMAQNDYLRNYEITLRRKDGRIVTLMENSFATRGPDGKVERYQGLLMDITEAKSNEDKILRRNRELGALNAMANIAARTFDLSEILRNTLYRTAELFGQNCDLILFDPETKQVVRCESSRHHEDPVRGELRTLVEGSLVEVITGVEEESLTERELHRMPQAARQWLFAHNYRSFVFVVMYSQRKAMGFLMVSSHDNGQFTETDRNLAIAIARQLGSAMERVLLYEETAKAYADLRDTQEQLLQSEKMSAVGQLVSGVAHELNNPLTAILGYAQLLETEPIGERAQDYVRKLYRQVQRTHRVVENLLSFSRQRKPIQSQVDLRRVLEDTIALRDFDLKLNRIIVERNYDPNTPFITGDAHQLEQVFLNIINNAVDAIMDAAHSGTLWVRTFPADKNRACVEIRDSGPGIKEPGKVFDPFYTTKKLGKGTGLGLSICYGIIKEHGGDIVAFNHEQGGAVFLLWLPVVRGASKTPPVPKHELSPQ
jgi:two-component system NtrC family sensor kinase